MPEKTQNDKNKIEITLQPATDIPVSRLYSNHVEISQSPHDFTLKFCDATPIYSFKEFEKNKGIHKIPIVAEIAIPFHVMQPLIDALQKQFDQYKKITGAINEKQVKK